MWFRTRIVTVLSEVLPVLGTIGLLGLWIFQQTDMERRIAELQELAVARGVLQTYESHNSLFNAINELVSNREGAPDQLRIYQIYNYELGLAAIEKVLPSSDKVGIPPATGAFDGFPDVRTKMHNTQMRLEALQTRLDKREAIIRKSAEVERETSLWLYVGFSLVTILGAVFKVATALSGT